MIALRKRVNTFHVDFLLGRQHVVRGPLGTRNHGAALRLIHRIEIALAEGPRSPVWAELRPVIPHPTFDRFANYAGVEGKLVLTWREFRELFESHKKLQVRLDKLASTTLENYQYTLDAFESFLDEQHITMLQNVDDSVIDRFQSRRIGQIKTRKSDGSSALRLDLVHLHHAFAFAIEKGFVQRNPVRVAAKRRDPSSGAQPYTANELRDLRNHADEDLFLSLIHI